MTDWHSEATLRRNADSWKQLHHAVLGVYAWEWLVSLDFDIDLLLGRRPFRWPMVFYLWARYGFLAAVTLMAVVIDTPTKIDCQAGLLIVSFLFNTTISLSTLNLCIRTMAAWNMDRRVVALLIVCVVGHFALAIRTMVNIQAVWITGTGCAILYIEPHLYAALYGYAMVFDLVIIGLTTYKLWPIGRKGQRNPSERPDDLAQLLFRDGLAYFLVAFVVNAVAVVFSTLNLNIVMSLIADAPATAATTMVAGRVIRRLNTYKDKGGNSTTDNVPLDLTRTILYTSDYEREIDSTHTENVGWGLSK